MTSAAQIAVPTSALALVSTYHLSLLLLRRHRSFPDRLLSPLLLPSLALTVQPWLQPTPLWVVVGSVAHLAWFWVCERLLPPPRATGPTRAATTAETPQRSAAAATSSRHRGFAELPVLAVIEETPEIRTFRLARPADLEFAAGQFLTVRAAIEGTPMARCYSISSAPQTRGYLEISVRRQGRVSALLHDTVRTRSTLTVGGPAGKFVYPDGDRRPIVLLAGGIGITPLLSMLRHGVATEPGRQITLIYAARTVAHLAFVDELLVIARRHPAVTLHLLVSREPATAPYAAGRVTAAVVAERIADPSGAIFMMCGPGPMIADLERDLAALGVPGGQIRSEAFEAASAAAEGAVAHAPTQTAVGTPGEFRLTLQRSGREVVLNPRDTLLDIAESAGADIPSSCRSGLCLTCRCRLLEGDVHCDSDILDDEERAEGYILPCVSWARSDCVLDA